MMLGECRVGPMCNYCSVLVCNDSGFLLQGSKTLAKRKRQELEALATSNKSKSVRKEIRERAHKVFGRSYLLSCRLALRINGEACANDPIARHGNFVSCLADGIHLKPALLGP